MAGSEHDDEKTRRARRPRPPRPLELSPEGRVVIRSSSHPPDARGEALDASGVHPHPAQERPRHDRHSGLSDESAPATPAATAERDRFKRSTPAERPRKRKSLRAVQLPDARPHRPTPRAYPRRSAPPLMIAEPGETSGRFRKASPLPTAPLPSAAPAPSGARHASESPDAGATERDEVTRRSRRPAPPADPTRGLETSQLPTALVATLLFALVLWWLLS